MSTAVLVGTLVLQLILIILSAFFAATEIAVLQLKPAEIKAIVQEGDKKAKRILKHVESPSKFISAIQVGLRLSGFMASAFLADKFAAPLTDWAFANINILGLSWQACNNIAVVLLVLLLVIFMFVFGELVPKQIALHKPFDVAKRTTGLVSAVSVLLKPLIMLLHGLSRAVLKLFGLSPRNRQHFITEEDIRMLVDAGTENGAIDDEEKEMIENVFRLDKTPAKDIMTNRVDVVTLEADASTQDIIETIKESGLSRIPVYDGSYDDFIGVLSTRNYLLNLREENPKPLREILHRPWFVPDTVSADVLLKNMKDRKEHLAIVIDEYGGFAGVVTLEDIIEKIFGDIYDEFDQAEEPEIYKIEDNIWRVAGDTDIETIEKELGIKLNEDREYETLGGLVFSTLSSIPADGCEITVDVEGLHIHTEPVIDHHVEWAKVGIIEETEEDEEENEVQ